jgi:F-type H+-transporting ATPase subunit delta
MKITAQPYAKALYESTKSKSQSEIDAVISGFAKILQKNNQLKLKKEISKKFKEIYNRENGIVEAEVISKEKLDNKLVDKLIGFVKDKYKAKEVVIDNVVNESIKGGIIVRVGDEVMDGSVERKLKELKSILEKWNRHSEQAR